MSPGAPGPLSGGPMPVPPTGGQPQAQPGMPPGYISSNRPSAEEYAKMAQMGGRPPMPGQPGPGGRPPPQMYMPGGQPPNGQRYMPMGMPPGMNPMGGPMPGMPKGQMSNGMEYGYYNPNMGNPMMMSNDVDMKQASEPSDVSSFLEMGNDDSNKNENLLDSLLETGDDNYSVQTEQDAKLEELGSITYPHKILASHFNMDGSLLATAGSDKKVTIWKTETREPAMTFEGHTYSVVDVRFSPIITKYVASCAQDQTIRIWDTDSKSIQWTLKMPAIQSDNQTFNATSIDFHPRQPYLMASSDSGGILRFWNLQEQNSSSWIEGAAKKTARFQSLSGDTVAAGYDTLVKILDVTTERELRTIGDAHDKAINAITWSPNGDKLVTISDDVVKVWDASNNNFEHIKTTKLPRKLQACVYTNENKIYIGGYLQIHVWDFMHSDKAVAVKAHETSLSSISYGKDLLASTCLNGSIKFWKATDNKL
jgi:WD40 repeat protein